MEADFAREDDYVAVVEQRRDDWEYWQKRASKYVDDLDDADASIRRLTARVKELEQELEDARDYADKRGGKRARYEPSFSPRDESPVEPTTAPISQRGTTDVQEDVMMEENDMSAFPPLPPPSQPIVPVRSAFSVPHGANWTPVRLVRPMPSQ